MKDSEILKQAKAIITDKHSVGICNAISQVHVRNANLTEQKAALRAWIHVMLWPYAFYEGWLKGTHPKVFKHMNMKTIREGRLQWLDWMIAECKKQEASKKRKRK